MTIEEIFAKRVQEKREQRGWSQAELSRRVTALGHGIKKDAMSKIEKGERRVTLDDAVAFAAVLSVPLHTLLVTSDGNEEVALTPKLKVRMPFVGSWLAGETPLDRDDVEHYDDAGDLLWLASAAQSALPDLLKSKPNEREVEMARAHAERKHLQAKRLESTALRPEAKGMETRLRDMARDLHDEATRIEALLPNERKR